MLTPTPQTHVLLTRYLNYIAWSFKCWSACLLEEKNNYDMIHVDYPKSIWNIRVSIKDEAEVSLKYHNWVCRIRGNVLWIWFSFGHGKGFTRKCNNSFLTDIRMTRTTISEGLNAYSYVFTSSCARIYNSTRFTDKNQCSFMPSLLYIGQPLQSLNTTHFY